MLEIFKIRIILLLLDLILGCVLAFILGFVWFFFKLIILGYGDSGPQWINTVYTYIEIISIFSGAIASQWYYHYAHKKGKL